MLTAAFCSKLLTVSIDMCEEYKPIMLPLWFGETDEAAEHKLEIMRKAVESINSSLEEGKFPNIDAGFYPLPMRLETMVLPIDMPLTTLTKHDREGGKHDAEAINYQSLD